MNDIPPRPSIETVGSNPTRLWGLTMQERHRRIGAANGYNGTAGEAALLVNANYVADPAWVRHIAENPDTVLTIDGIPALSHVTKADEITSLRSAMENGAAAEPMAGLNILRFEERPTIENKQLRKRETPFLTKLEPATVGLIERESYFGAYKGVTDVLTKYLWPEWALVLTRGAAKIGMTPNMITAIGAILCIAATFAFAYGYYWMGMTMGLGFMVLDTVDGKLARCTITSSWWGNIFDHGIDLVHPPFWWWFWATGLLYWGLALDQTTFWLVQGAIQGGYIVQRVIEGVFIARNGGIHIHVWRRFDSHFRLITARRNPNMIILLIATAFGRPDIGIIAVAWWTTISLLVHLVRLFQAELVRSKESGHLTSWLAEN